MILVGSCVTLLDIVEPRKDRMNITQSTALAALLLVVIGAAGCDREAVAARDTSSDRSQSVRAAGCEEIVVPHGFALGWRRFNHRLSRWGMLLDHDDCLASSVDFTHVGGVFSTNPFLGDYPKARYHWQTAATGPQVRAARVSLRDVVGFEGVREGRATFSPKTLGLEGFDRYVALVEGLRFDTSIRQGPNYPALYNPGRGYTMRSIGAEVGATETSGDVVVDYVIHFDTGPTPERVFMNRTLRYARVGAQLDVLIVGVRDAPVTVGTVSYQMEHERPAPFMDADLPPASEESRTVAIVGEPGGLEGFYGLQKFHMDLDFDNTCTTDEDCSFGHCDDRKRCVYGDKRLGEYIREIAVDVRLTDYDRTTGRARFLMHGYTSNASSFVAYYPLRYTFDGAFAWIQAGESTRPRSLDREFETGSVRFDLSDR